MQVAARERMFSEAPDSVFEAISLTANEKDIKWEEAGKEFSFKGQLYDVIRTRLVNGQTILICSNDEKEDQLLGRMNDITKSSHQDTGNKNRPPDSKLLYDFAGKDYLQDISFSFRAVPAFIHYNAALQGQFAATLVPPPRA